MTQTGAKRLSNAAWLGAAAVLLIGCADPEIILEGERLDVRAPLSGELLVPLDDDAATQETAFDAPEPVALTEWTHRAATATHFAPHAAFAAAPSLAWSVNIGQGNSRRHRITGQPVVSDSRVFVMDSQTKVSAVSTSGQSLWSRDLTPPEERNQDASGGGIAVENGQIYATTGFGEVVAVDAASGAEI